MTGYLLDRDVLSAAENPDCNTNVHNWIAKIPDSDLYMSAVTVMEAQKGFARERGKAKTADDVEAISIYMADFDRLVSAFDEKVLAVDRAVARRWGELLAERDANVMDAAVAATASVHGLVVATRNARHFRGRGVRMIDPFNTNPRVTP